MGPILEKKVLQAEKKQKTTVEAGQKGSSPLQATLALQSFCGVVQFFAKSYFFPNFWYIMRLCGPLKRTFRLCVLRFCWQKVSTKTQIFFSLALKDRNLKLDRIGLLLFPFTFIYKQNFRLPLLSVIFDIAQYYIQVGRQVWV